MTEKRPWGWKVTVHTYIKDEDLPDQEDADALFDAINEKSVFAGMTMEPVEEEPNDQIAT